MKRKEHLTHEFVEFIPDHHQLQDGIVYISIQFATAVHKCCCGCGEEVVTPLSPTSWQMTFDGETISLYPSIGNWNLPCRSHYWIRQDRVQWAPRWSQKEINLQKTYETQMHKQHYRGDELTVEKSINPTSASPMENKSEQNFWTRLIKQLFKGE